MSDRPRGLSTLAPLFFALPLTVLALGLTYVKMMRPARALHRAACWLRGDA